MPNETPQAPTAPSAPAAEATQEKPVESPELEAKETASEEVSGEESTEQPKQTKAEKKAEVKRLKKLKLKVDQKEIEEELPFEVDEDPKVIDYLTKQLQLAKMGQKRAQQYSDLEKEVAAFISELKANPAKVLADPNIGIDIKELAAKVIQQEIEDSQKSPEQKEKERLEAELKAIKEEREREKEELQRKELERLQEQEYERYDLLISDALSKSDLPKTPYTVKKVAEYMLLALQNDVDVNPGDVIPLVREEMLNDIKEMFGAMPDEVIESVVGKDVITRIRKKSVAKAKEAKASTPLSSKTLDTGKSNEPKDKKPEKKQSFKEFFGV